MAGLNKVMIIGNLGADPEVTYARNGMTLAKFQVATSFKQKDGEEKVSWHRVTCFEKQAELAGEYLRKGSKVYIEGELQYGSYEKEGVKHYTTEIVCRQMQFLSRNEGEAKARPQGERGEGGGYKTEGRRAPPQEKPEFDDDIPF